MSAALWATSASAQSIEELREMSITTLANIDVTSVTKSSAALGEAPASIYVITHDDIVRSGTLTLPGILRLAPNLQVMRGGPTDVVITARGLSGNRDAQNFSNKLLVLIDGRSVYTPLFSGVYWDMQDVLPEDVERIEVISGPGSTLWGANAVNGVINIITRNAGVTQGAYATAVVGNNTREAGVRYGDRIGDSFDYRLFVKARRSLDSSSTIDNDAYRVQGGFRMDWTPTAVDSVMVQGDIYRGTTAAIPPAGERFNGHDIVARWNRSLNGGSTLQLQAYYDHTGRESRMEDANFWVKTFDFDAQHAFDLGSRHRIVWGGGARVSRYDIDGTASLNFVPDRRTLFLANIFVQDSIQVTQQLTGIVGLKLERDPYSGVALLPNVRVSWRPDASTLFWAAASRAIRSPTPFDRDVVESLNGTRFLIGPSSFRSEKLSAYEAGTRLILSRNASLSFSAFYNDYEDLRTVEPAPGGFLPLQWGNGLKGHAHGFDAWADYRVADWWRLKPGYSLLIQKLRPAPGASGLLGPSQAGNDPRHRVSLRSSMDIGRRINLDADLRYISALPDPHVPGYVELGARLGWQFIDEAELSLSGFNLLHKKHRELPASQATPVSRSVFVALKWHI